MRAVRRNERETDPTERRSRSVHHPRAARDRRSRWKPAAKPPVTNGRERAVAASNRRARAAFWSSFCQRVSEANERGKSWVVSRRRDRLALGDVGCVRRLLDWYSSEERTAVVRISPYLFRREIRSNPPHSMLEVDTVSIPERWDRRNLRCQDEGRCHHNPLTGL